MGQKRLLRPNVSHGNIHVPGNAYNEREARLRAIQDQKRAEEDAKAQSFMMNNCVDVNMGHQSRLDSVRASRLKMSRNFSDDEDDDEDVISGLGAGKGKVRSGCAGALAATSYLSTQPPPSKRVKPNLPISKKPPLSQAPTQNTRTIFAPKPKIKKTVIDLDDESDDDNINTLGDSIGQYSLDTSVFNTNPATITTTTIPTSNSYMSSNSQDAMQDAPTQPTYSASMLGFSQPSLPPTQVTSTQIGSTQNTTILSQGTSLVNRRALSRQLEPKKSSVPVGRLTAKQQKGLERVEKMSANSISRNKIALSRQGSSIVPGTQTSRFAMARSQQQQSQSSGFTQFSQRR